MAESTECTDLAAMAPREIEGWALKDEACYDTSNLFDYIDGGAEVYRSFRMQRALARRYGKEGADDLIADLFDMGSAEDAYGVYHHDLREGDSAGIGQESEYVSGALAFWKGRYCVSILTMAETEESKRAVLALGRAIADAIREEGAPPDLLHVLPEQGRIPRQVFYFHDHFCLNYHFFLADKNLLDLGPDTEGLLAWYAAGGTPEAAAATAVDRAARSAVLIIRYPSADRAEKALAAFRKGYMPEADPAGIVQTENGQWSGARQEGMFLIGVLDAPSRTEVERLIAGVLKVGGKRITKKGCSHE